MENLVNTVGATGGGAGIVTAIWNLFTTKQNKEMIAKHEEKLEVMKTELTDHKREVAKDYVSNDRLETVVKSVESKLDIITKHLIDKNV